MFALGAHDETRAYVVRHVLYKEALELYKYNPEEQREITQLYADYLQSDSKHKDAAIGEFISQSHEQNVPANTVQLMNRWEFMTRPINATTWLTCGANHSTVR